jgi:hypothetical protein
MPASSWGDAARRARRVRSWGVPDDLTIPLDTTGEPAGTGGVLGVFRRWGAGNGSAAISFSMLEELFGPTKHQARIEVEAQRRLAQPVPAPTDPPDLAESDPAAPDRPRGRFTGIVVVRRP